MAAGIAIVDNVPHVTLVLNGEQAHMGPHTARELAESLFAWAKVAEAERRLLAKEAR